MSPSAQGQLDAARRQFLEELWKGMVLLAVIGVPVSLSRIGATGWLPLYGIHVFVGTSILVLYALRARLPTWLRAALLIAILWTIGLAGLFTIGFPAVSVWWLVLSCLIASTFYSIRVGLAMTVATTLVVLAAAFAYMTGFTTLSINAADYMRVPSAWATLLLVLGTFTFTVLRSNWAYHRSMDRLLAEVNEQRDTIERMAMHDPLTGLPVARLADDRIAMAMHNARRSGRKVGLLFIDLDNFKIVNDSLGHQAGDFVLQEVAGRLTRAIRSQDTAARIGGDELLAVLADLSEDTMAALVAARILSTISAPIDFQGRQLRVGASIGIALFPDHSEDAQVLRILADEAMYAAKKSGKSCYAFAEHRPSGNLVQSEPPATIGES